MIRILIADDETQIRRGIRGLVAAILEGDEEVEFLEAADGIEAFERARDGSPDVLFLDIHMPRLKGLDLVERLGTLDRDWVVIVVTGHDEFEYARRALTLQVFDFLLKPVPEAQFRDVLGRARKELSQRREERRFVDWSKDRVVGQRAVLQQTLVKDWLEGRLEVGEFDRSAAYLELKVPDRPVVALVTDGRALGPVRLALQSLPGALVVEDTDHRIAVVVGRDQAGWPALSALLDGPGAGPEGTLSRVEGVEVSSAAEVPGAWKQLVDLTSSPATEGGLVGVARTFLETRYPDPDLSLDAAAAYLKISPSYLSRLLKAATGRSFVAYLNHLRMEKAKALLDDPRRRVAEVAERVGYRDQNYFCRHFKAETGKTPKEWRTGGERRE